jgi:hypothetical protein
VALVAAVAVAVAGHLGIWQALVELGLEEVVSASLGKCQAVLVEHLQIAPHLQHRQVLGVPEEQMV